MKRSFLALAILAACAATADAQGPFRRFFAQPSCPNGQCPSPGMVSPAPFVPVPQQAPQPMPAVTTPGNLYDGSWPASRMGTGWFGFGVIGPGTGRGFFGRCR